MTEKTLISDSPRRWAWWCGGAIIAIGLILIALWLIVTSGWFLAWIIRPELERRLGGSVTISGANFDTDGTFQFNELILSVPDIDGPPGEILRLKHGRVVLDSSLLWRGEVEVLEAEIEQALIRISEDVQKIGDVNIGHLQPKWDGIDEPPTSLPSLVTIKDATVQVGRHQGDVFEVVGQRHFKGQMARSVSDQSQYDFELMEIDAPNAGQSLAFDGNWNLITNQFTSALHGFRLDEQVREMCPPVARAWWDQVNPHGAVELLEFTSSPEKGFGLKVTVDDLALTLPINPDGVWARFAGGKLYPTASRPRMQVSRGTIELDHSKLIFNNMVGTLGSSQQQSGLGSVPYRFDFEMTDLPEPSWGAESRWVEQIIDEAPFLMTFSTKGFQLGSEVDGSNVPIDLPYAVADVLQRFQLTGGSLEMEISLARSRSDQPGESTEIAINGKTWVRDATGAYEYFPYLLEEVNAYIDFNTDAAKIQFLTGSGSDGATVRVAGNITPLNDDASVSLSIATSPAPIDDRLRAAMLPEHQKILDSLFSRKAYELLRKDGLLPDKAWLENIEAERKEVVSKIRALQGQDVVDERLVSLRIKRARLDKLLEMGVFDMGGLVVLDLQVDRAEGEDEPTFVTGTVEGGKVGLLYEEFPYPVWLIDSVLRWTQDAIYLESKLPNSESDDGLYVVTSGGGQGAMRGRFGLEVIGDQVLLSPELDVQVLGDRVTPFLESAIPPIGSVSVEETDLLSGDGGKALMSALNLSADLDYIGEVTGINPDGGGAFYDVMVRLKKWLSCTTGRSCIIGWCCRFILASRLFLDGFIWADSCHTQIGRVA